MTSQLTVATLEKLHAHVLRMIDGGVDEARTSIEALRSHLKLSDIQSAPEPPLQDESALNEHLQLREFIVELFQTLFEVYCFATPVQMAPLRNHIRPYLQDIISQGIVAATLLRIEQVAVHHQAIQANTTTNVPFAAKKKVLTALVQERMALATLLHSIVSFYVPAQDQLTRLFSMLSKLEQGDPLTIPLLMTALAALRISSKVAATAVFIGTPARLLADHRHQLLQECPDDRHELKLSQLQQLRPSIADLTFQQSGLKDVVTLALSISEFYLVSHDEHAEESSLQFPVKDAFTSNALPWLITHILVNVDHSFDPLSSGLDILYRSVPREKTFITYYPLNDRLQEMTTIELQHLTVNIITRLSKLLTNLKTVAEVRMAEDKRPLPPPSASSSHPTHSHSEHYHHAHPHYHHHHPSTSHSSVTTSSSLVRSDIEIFSLFVSMLFEERPHACRIFWSEEPSVTAFFRFLQTITLTQHRRFQESSLHLVSSLINEPLTAAKAFQVVQNEMLGTVTWSALFAGLDYYVKAFKKLAPQPIHNSVISAQEVDFLISLLRLLRQVCMFDAHARRSILALGSHDTLALIFDFLTCSIPLRLKAALMESIAAFVSHASFHLLEHQHTAHRIWGFMEVIVIIPQLSLATIGHQKGGLRQELETRECVLQHYPLTIAYLHLLHNLTPPHLAYDEEGQGQYQQAIGGQLFALVDNLGSPNRPPGVQPYYEYMIQDIFLKAETRDYMNPKELWAQWKWVLSTILNCLIDLDMISLESHSLFSQQYAPSSQATNMAMVSSTATSTSSFYRLLADHPAFAMLSDLLDGKPILDGILRVISKAREVYNESALRQEEKATELKSAVTVQGNERPSLTSESGTTTFIKQSGSSATPSSTSPASGSASSSASPSFQSAASSSATPRSKRDTCLVDPTSYREYEDAVLFAFRILHQVLLMQSKFLYEFLPGVAGNSSTALSMRVPSSTTPGAVTASKLYVSSKRELDHHLASRREAVVDLMFFIQSPNQSVFLDTIGVLSIQVLTGLSLSPSFTQSRSNINSLVGILSSSDLAEPIKAAYRIRMTAPNGEKEPYVLHKYDEVQVKSIRLAMLQFLVHNLKSKAAPTIAHTLLGLAKDTHLDLQAPSVASTSLFAEIIKLLKEKEPLHLLIEEQAQALIYYLISNPQTFPLSAMMKGSDFFTFAAKVYLDPKRLYFAVPQALLDTTPFLTLTRAPRHMENRSTMTPLSQAWYSTPRQSLLPSNPATTTTTVFSQGPSFARQMCENVLHIVALLSSWRWTMKYLAVQIKAYSEQSAYLLALAKELYTDADICKMCILLDFLVAASIEEAQGQPWMAEDVQEVIVQLELQLPSGWPMRLDEQGCQVYDLKACQQILLKAYPSAAYKTPSAMTITPETLPLGQPKLTESTSSPMIQTILECFSYRNSQRQLFNAQLNCLQAWVELLSVSFLTQIDMFGSTASLKEVLKCLVIYVCKHLKSGPNEFREHLSKALLLLVSIINQVTSAESMDTLHLTEILRTILEGIKAGDSSIVVRGNLYTTLLIYLAFTTGRPLTMDLDSNQFRMSFRDSLASSFSSSSSASLLASSSTPHAMDGLTKMESQSLLMLRNQGGEKLLEILATDATHFSIWQTVALTLLDVLFVWSLRESRHWVFDYIQSKNVLRNFVNLIRTFSPYLVQVCHQVDLSPQAYSTLYIYESLMLLFTRLALNKSSCEALVASGVISMLADCQFLTYRMGAVSPALEGTSSTMSILPLESSQGRNLEDPYAYFAASSNVTVDMVSETLYRFNQILMPTLDLLIAITSAMSQSTDKHHEYLMKSISHFVISHAGTFERILRACFQMVQSAIPQDDQELELALLRQTSQIACLLEFLCKSKLPSSPILSEWLLMLFLRFARAEFQAREKQQQVETWMLQTCSHVVGYSFALLTDGKLITEPRKSMSLGGQESRLGTTGLTDAEKGPNSLRNPLSTRYLFDPDLAAAKDTYYSNMNRITLGLLILFMNQVMHRLRASLSFQATLLAKQRHASPAASDLDEWESLLTGGAVTFPDATYRLPLASMPKEKKEEVLKRQLFLKSKEVEKEIASALRILEITMCVLFLHLRYYTSISEEPSLSRVATGLSSASPFAPVHDLADYRSSQRHSLSLNNLKIDATSVLPELARTFNSLQLPESASSNLAFLEFLCQASLECISAFKAAPASSY